MGRYRVPVYYKKDGYLSVEADSETEAARKAQEMLDEMSINELDKFVDYMPFSETVDSEGITRED